MIDIFNTEKKDVNLKEFQKIIKYKFKDINFLKSALTHDSFFRNMEMDHSLCSVYERMEFFGDSILGVIVAEHLYNNFPDKPEGFLSKSKSNIVSEKFLAIKGASFRLPEFIIFSETEIKNGGREKKSIIADTVEALICAIYFDGGLKKVKKFIESFILPDFENTMLENDLINYKSVLQEYCQEKYQNTPTYNLISESGPDHAKNFEVVVLVNDEESGKGIGSSKKEAQQKAAHDACNKLNIKEKK